MSVRLCLSNGIRILSFCKLSKSTFARQKVGSLWETSLHCARIVPHGSTIYLTRESAKTKQGVRTPAAVEPTDHGVSPAFSDLVVLPNGCSADHEGLRVNCSAPEENLPMSCTSPDRKSTGIRQHVCTSCLENLCNFRKPDIITSQKADCATLCAFQCDNGGSFIAPLQL